MSRRPLRIEDPDAYYHIMNRGRGRQAIFHDEAYFQAFCRPCWNLMSDLV